jgi:hypothetical protein
MQVMNAVRLFEFGGPDKLVYGEHPIRRSARAMFW